MLSGAYDVESLRGGFIRDDQGGGTIMGLFWFILIVGICGLAVDTTNGFRNRTMLQATADAAALAAAVDLPDANTATATAVAYSTQNMPAASYGDVLQAGDVYIGAWDEPSGTLDTTSILPDAVYVHLRQTGDNSNAVPVNFLRIVGLTSWDINVEAVAQRFIPDCLKDGLIARGMVDISSNNNFVNEICIHGQQGVAMQNHNYHELGVNISMPNLPEDLTIPSGGMDSNPGLPEALRENRLDPRMVNHVDTIVNDLLTQQAYVMPAYIDATQAVIVKDEKWNLSDIQPGRIYHVQCAPNKNFGIPNNMLIQNVAIISDCQVGVGSGVTMIDVVLASRAGGNPGGGNGGNGGNNNNGNGGPGVENASINFSADVSLGLADNCTPGGGVQIFSNASVLFSSSMTINGLQVVAAGDVDLGARDQGINGITVQAGGDITLTSNNAFGICSGGAPNLFTANYYRLVH